MISQLSDFCMMIGLAARVTLLIHKFITALFILLSISLLTGSADYLFMYFLFTLSFNILKPNPKHLQYMATVLL